jgi:hypothetical protein
MAVIEIYVQGRLKRYITGYSISDAKTYVETYNHGNGYNVRLTKAVLTY